MNTKEPQDKTLESSMTRAGQSRMLRQHKRIRDFTLDVDMEYIKGHAKKGNIYELQEFADTPELPDDVKKAALTAISNIVNAHQRRS